MNRDSVNQVDETDTDNSDCIDHQVVTIDTRTGYEVDADSSKRPEH